MSEFHAEAPQATASEGLAQGLYVAAKAEFESATLRVKGDQSTNEPPRPTIFRAVLKQRADDESRKGRAFPRGRTNESEGAMLQSLLEEVEDGLEDED